MAFLKNKNAIAQGSGGGNYLNPGKLQSGGSMRFALASDEPLEMYECWGENPEGAKRPFRFLEEPTAEDIEAEMGSEFQRREKIDGTGFEPAKFVIAVAVWNYESSSIGILSLSQKGLIKELDGVSQEPDYEDLLAWDFSISREGVGLATEYTLRPLPQKGDRKEIAKALKAAEADGFDIKRLVTGGNPFKAD
jgi:hypothetical protein